MASRTRQKKASPRPAGSASKRSSGPTILLVDDHPIWRDSLKRLLERKRAGRIVGEAADGETAIELASSIRPDVVIMDVDIPRIDGIEATKRLHQENPKIKVLFLSALDDESDVSDAIQQGASGYLLKTAAPEQIVDAVHRVHAGELVFPASLSAIVREKLLGKASSNKPRHKLSRTSVEASNTFRREGDFWTLSYDGETTRLKDSKGMRYLSMLIYSPGEGVHSLDLMSAENGLDPDSRSRAGKGDPELVASTGRSEPILDSKAKAAYRARLEELREEADEAASWNDNERASRAEEEIAAITSQLTRALGLSGRDRHAGSAAERARVNVSRAISTALSRISEAHSGLGEHLGQSIKTGGYCTYQPREEVSWST